MMGNKVAMSPQRVRQGRERRDRLRHGHHRREGRRAMEGLARRPGRVRPGLAPEGDRRDPGRRVQGRDHARTKSSRACPTSAATRSRVREVDRRDRRRSASGHQRSKASAKLRPVFRNAVRRQRDRRQQLADERRRRRGAARLRAGDQGLRPDAAGAFRQLLGRRRAPGSDGHRPDGSDSEGAQAGRPEQATRWTGSSSTKRSPRRRWR